MDSRINAVCSFSEAYDCFLYYACMPGLLPELTMWMKCSHLHHLCLDFPTVSACPPHTRFTSSRTSNESYKTKFSLAIWELACICTAFWRRPSGSSSDVIAPNGYQSFFIHSIHRVMRSILRTWDITAHISTATRQRYCSEQKCCFLSFFRRNMGIWAVMYMIMMVSRLLASYVCQVGHLKSSEALLELLL